MQNTENRFYLLDDHQPSNELEIHYKQIFPNSSLAFEYKNPDYLISPGLRPKSHQDLGLYSPSPLKKTFFALYEENQASSQDIDSSSGQKKSTQISQILDFEESPPPKKLNFQVETEGRTPIHKRKERKKAKGLRTLSQCVYEIVLQQKITTYKEVANRLVSQFRQESLRPRDAAKDEQNIKRRVYDALNVLISASVLRKSGKKVMVAQDLEVQEEWENPEDQETLNILKKQIFQRDEILQGKREELQILRRKHELLKIIFQRNKKKKYLKKEKVKFPLIGLTFSSNTGISGLLQKTQRTKKEIEINQIENISGDLDLIGNIDVFTHGVEQIFEQEESLSF